MRGVCDVVVNPWGFVGSSMRLVEYVILQVFFHRSVFFLGLKILKGGQCRYPPSAGDLLPAN